MAKKEETISLIDTFSEFKELKNIDRTTMVSVLEESFRSVIAKMFGTDENYDVIVNPDKGDFEIWRNREVVADEDLTNPNMQISLTEAQKIDASYEVGEEVTDEVIFAKFGRRAILNLRQTLASKILELEKDSIYNKYIDKVGTIINAEVYQIWKKEMLLLDDEGNELLLPKTEQIPADFYRKGETARAVVARVDNKNNNPKIILSRTSPVFLQRLFEMEVPEINDGLITIKKIARIPGERAKIAVESYDDRIDPVGACVGVKGSRLISSWNPYLLLVNIYFTGLVWVSFRKSMQKTYFCSAFTSTARASLETISFLMFSMKLSKDAWPSSPLKRLRTDTTPSSSSFWPTTSIYGILFF